ncbi:MAG: histidinol dehydrogenase, partial [Planctomycetota bacterium]|nr:histidinol dehydrogenase [Planctomycetota bacterium]
LAPEHLHLAVNEPRELAEALRSYGALFVGGRSGEVFGDYGAGPNHVLPTGGGARYQAGLSVLTYLRPATFLELEDPGPLTADTAALARLEGLEAHARAAERRPATLLG